VVDRIHQSLKHLATIEAGTSSGANAVWHWIAAGTLMQEFPGAWMQDSTRAAWINAELAAADQAANAVFPEPFTDHLEAPVPWWLPAQDRLVADLLMRSELALASGDVAAAQADLQRIARMAAAAGSHPSIASSLHAAAATQALANIINEIASQASPDQRRQLAQWIRTIPTRDPMGMSRAASETASRLDALNVLSDGTPILSIPDSHNKMLNALAYARGRVSLESHPEVYVEPEADATALCLTRWDRALIDGWYELGQRQDDSLDFQALGMIDVDAPAHAAAEAARQAREALRQ